MIDRAGLAAAWLATRRTGLALALGTAGGGLAAWAGLPAPWISGAIVAVAAAALLARLELEVALWLRRLAFVALGYTMGASVTPESLTALRLWPLSLAFLALSVLLTTLAQKAYLERAHRWDPATASLSAVPGAFTYVMLLTSRSRADGPRVAVAQLMRLVVLSALLPSLLTALDPQAGALAPPAHNPTPGGWLTLLAGLLAAGAAGALCEHWRMPAGYLIGSMLFSALLHGLGLSAARIPPAWLIPGYVVTGAFIGSRFAGLGLGLVLRTMAAGLVGVLLALLIAGGFAWLAARWLGLPLAQLWLAYAPGGVEVMAILALALQFDPAFVSAHHVLRFLALSLLVPLWLRRHLL